MKLSKDFKITILIIVLCLAFLFFKFISNDSTTKLGCSYRHIQKTINKNWQKNNCSLNIDLMPQLEMGRSILSVAKTKQAIPCGCEGYTMYTY